MEGVVRFFGEEFLSRGNSQSKGLSRKSGCFVLERVGGQCGCNRVSRGACETDEVGLRQVLMGIKVFSFYFECDGELGDGFVQRSYVGGVSRILGCFVGDRLGMGSR